MAPGDSSRRGTGIFQGERQKPIGTHQLPLFREQPGKKPGLSRSTAAALTVKGSTVDGGSRAPLLQVTAAQAGDAPCSLDSRRTRWTKVAPCKRSNPAHAKSLGSPCPSCARLTVTDPHTEPTANQGSASHKMLPCQLPAAQCLFPSQGAVWDGQVPTAGPSHGAALGSRTPPRQQPSRQHRGLGRGQEVFSRNEVRRKVFLTKNCSLCLSVSGVNSLDIGMISPLRMIMALQ